MLKIFPRIALNQTRNLLKFIQGRPLIIPSLSSGTLDADDVQIARHWLRNQNDWGNADIIKQYEEEFARWNGSNYAYSFMGGRVALSACIYALNLKDRDEVIIPGYTCVVVLNAFKYVGVRPVYADIELDTYGLDLKSVESKITSRTKAILLQHLYGLVSRDYESVLEIAQKYGLLIIEDCAHATGATYKGAKVGNYGTVGFYSSEQSKVFTTIQGGIAVTNDDIIAERMERYQDKAMLPNSELIDRQLHSVILNYYNYKHPQRWLVGDFYDLLYGKKRLISTTVEEIKGMKPANYGRKMPAPIAAIGSNQLKKIDFYNQRRREGAKKWDDWCDKHGYKKPCIVPESVPVYLRYPVMVEPEKKADTSWAYTNLNISLGLWFESNIHPSGWPVDGCPNADEAVLRCINFPCLAA
jgi:perosamine synthetase